MTAGERSYRHHPQLTKAETVVLPELRRPRIAACALGVVALACHEPTGSWQFSQPVYVLVGRGSTSSNETSVGALKGLPYGMLIGDTTAGSSGSPKSFALVGEWIFDVPAWSDPIFDEALQRARTFAC